MKPMKARSPKIWKIEEPRKSKSRIRDSEPPMNRLIPRTTKITNSEMNEITCNTISAKAAS